MLLSVDVCLLESWCLHILPPWTSCRFLCAGSAAAFGIRAGMRANVATAVGPCTAAIRRGRASTRNFRAMTTDARPRNAPRSRQHGTSSKMGRWLRTRLRRPCQFRLHRLLPTRLMPPSMVQTDQPSATGQQIGPPHAVVSAQRGIMIPHAHTIRYTASAVLVPPARASPISLRRQGHMWRGRSSQGRPPRACAAATTVRVPRATGSRPDCRAP